MVAVVNFSGAWGINQIKSSIHPLNFSRSVVFFLVVPQPWLILFCGPSESGPREPRKAKSIICAESPTPDDSRRRAEIPRVTKPEREVPNKAPLPEANA